MVLGLFIYLSGRKYLPAEELKSPSEDPALRAPLTREDWMCVVYLLILIPVLAISLLTNQEIFNA
jgi:POT family proton-dependent oligopeptide transporter